MICPYCHTEMKQGCLHGAGASGCMVFWMPKEYDDRHAFPPSTKNRIREKGGIVIRTNSLTEMADAFYVCDGCGKMIADVADIQV